MIEKSDLQTLEELLSRYSIVLMDNSVLSNYLGAKQDPISIEDKIIALEEEHQSRTILIDYLKKGAPCFITSLVLEEFKARDNYPYKKRIKRAGSRRDRELLKLRRKIRENCKEHTKLIDTFQDNNRILNLNENEHNLYRFFDKTYSGLLSLYELSEVDFDLLISGAVVSQTRGPSDLIAGDFGIVRAWSYIWRKERISTEQFGFAIRKGINDFKILY